MKQRIALITCFILCLWLITGCVPAVSPASAIKITVGEVTPGTTVAQIPVYVTIDGQPVACETDWIIYFDDGYDYLSGSDTIPENYRGRLDVWYFLPKGVAPGDIDVTLDAPGGAYDGTGEGATSDTGEIEAWSHIQYDFESPAPIAPLQTDVSIRIGELTPGATFDSVPITITVNGVPADYEAEWIIYYTDDYDYLSGSDTIPKDFWGRLDLWYFLPKGVDPGDINVTLDAPGGTYDGTGEGATSDTGEIEAWSHIQYGTEPAVPETTAPATAQPEATAPTTPPQPESSEHVHNWVKNDALSQVPTCYEEGWNHIACTGCDQAYREHVPSYDHSWNTGAPTIIQAPTCTQSGKQTIPCNNCISTYTEELPPLGHDFALHAFAYGSCPTGITWSKVCSRCGASEEYTTAPSSHVWSISYLNGRLHQLLCSVCGDIQEASHTCDANGLCSGCGEYIIN